MDGGFFKRFGGPAPAGAALAEFGAPAVFDAGGVALAGFGTLVVAAGGVPMGELGAPATGAGAPAIGRIGEFALGADGGMLTGVEANADCEEGTGPREVETLPMGGAAARFIGVEEEDTIPGDNAGAEPLKGGLRVLDAAANWPGGTGVL